MGLSKGHGAHIILETGGTDPIVESFERVTYGVLSIVLVILLLVTNIMWTYFPWVRHPLTIKGSINGPIYCFEKIVTFYPEHKIHPIFNRAFAFDEAKYDFLWRVEATLLRSLSKLNCSAKLECLHCDTARPQLIFAYWTGRCKMSYHVNNGGSFIRLLCPIYKSWRI